MDADEEDGDSHGAPLCQEVRARQERGAGRPFRESAVLDQRAGRGEGSRTIRIRMKPFATLFATLLVAPSLCLAAIKATTPNYLQKAEEAIQNEDYDTALGALNEAINEHPENTAARIWRARILAERGQLDKAQEDLDTVLSAQPDNAAAILFSNPHPKSF